MPIDAKEDGFLAHEAQLIAFYAVSGEKVAMANLRVLLRNGTSAEREDNGNMIVEARARTSISISRCGRRPCRARSRRPRQPHDGFRPAAAQAGHQTKGSIMTDEAAPILAHETPLPDMLWAALRQIAPPVATFALGKRWIDNDMLILLTALAGIVWPILAGQLKTRRRSRELATLAASPEVPAHLAQLKSQVA